MRPAIAAAGLAVCVALLACAHAAAAQTVRRTVATLPFDHGVIVIDAWSDGRVVVGGSATGGTTTVRLAPGAVTDFVGATERVMARRVAYSRRERIYRSEVDDDSTGAGVSLARHVVRGRSTYRLFFSDANASGFPIDVSPHELRLFLSQLRRGVETAQALAVSPPAADSAP